MSDAPVDMADRIEELEKQRDRAWKAAQVANRDRTALANTGIQLTAKLKELEAQLFGQRISEVVWMIEERQGDSGWEVTLHCFRREPEAAALAEALDKTHPRSMFRAVPWIRAALAKEEKANESC